ncbi:hypothetical protein NQZ67_16940 [Paenibacillus sp. SCIV0701]|uniref:Uncharacterized protein n=1 Tax=Paenibacillus soyae TaxID=2969249 RepID=A0A9X2MTP5_9BACL|nr:hypothetical protein [Paenibacillus soyae]MCR2805576.1 hypothetical protein [Paenibacillus soyae]
MNNKWVVYLLALAVFLIGTVEHFISRIIQMVATEPSVTASAAGLLVTGVTSTDSGNRIYSLQIFLIREHPMK